MNSKTAAAVAVLLCCLACTKVDYELGGNLIPDSSRYTLVTGQTFPMDVQLKQVDSLSGYSNTYATFGSIRDDVMGLTSRACVLTLFPLDDTLEFGENPVVKRFHISMALDTISVEDESQKKILQSVGVYALKDPLYPQYDYGCNTDYSSKVDWSKTISVGTPVINGQDSLSFDFTPEYAQQFLSLTQEDIEDIDRYREKTRGFYLNTETPYGNGGRINLFSFQLGYSSSEYYLTGNYAKLDITTTIDGEKVDTAYFFYLSPSDVYDVDSLVTNSTSGSLPQYALNLTTQDASKTAEIQADRKNLCIQGGGGLKPLISAKELKHQVVDIIKSNGHDPAKVTFSRASMIFEYDAPDEKYEGLRTYPDMLSPTVKLHVLDTTGGVSNRIVEYDGISDSSSSTENQGDIDLSLQRYSPDITYHLQELINVEDDVLDKGHYDIWLLIMYYKTVTTTDESASSLSDYYSMLAYQSYYSNMYGGYGGYSSGYDSYSNYYSYMMAAQYASQSATTESTTLELDKERYYKATLCGPEYPDSSRRPRLVFSYMVPKE